MNRRYLAAVALLIVLAVAFGVLGTIAPPLVEGGASAQGPQESSSVSTGHFTNPPSYDSGWVDISSRAGQYLTLTHGLNTTDVVVDITGKQRLEPMGGSQAWSRTYGGIGNDYGYSLIHTSDGGYALAGYSDSPGTAGSDDFWLVKTDASGKKLWERFYGGTGFDKCWSLIQTDDGGYALLGQTNSVGTAGFNDFWLVKTDAAGNELWSMFYGGTSNDFGYSVIQTSDGGYALAGASGSTGTHGGFDLWLVKTDASGNKVGDWFYGGMGHDYAYSVVQLESDEYVLTGSSWSGVAGGIDFWLVKVDASGNKLWDMFYGGAGTDEAYSLVHTSDGGYALAGYSNSLGATGGSNDFWLVKTDASGNKLWDKFYGGTGDDCALSLVENGDLEFELAGYSDSPGAVGLIDAWLVKASSTGNMLWNKTYGGIRFDYARSVVPTDDGGYAFGGNSDSYGTIGNDNSWLVKVNGEMNREHRRGFGEASIVSGWTTTYGGSGIDAASSITQTSDGGYAIACDSNSTGSAGGFDVWLVKVDAYGNKMWDKFYGYEGLDKSWDIVQTSDGGYAIAGESNSTGSAGSFDFWLVKTDAAGNKLWDKFYGGIYEDSAYSLVQTSDGGFALTGLSGSPGTHGDWDFWLVKTDANGNKLWDKFYGGTDLDWPFSIIESRDGGFTIAGLSASTGTAGGDDAWLVKTDAFGNPLWDKFYGGTGDDNAMAVIQTSDGGYAFVGDSTSPGSAGSYDAWLVKTDASGNLLWNKFYGGTGGDTVYSLIQTSDGGYALGSGHTYSFGSGGADFWLVKTDESGNTEWIQTYGGVTWDSSDSPRLVHTADGAYVFAGHTYSYGSDDVCLVKTDVENGLNWVGSTNRTITLYRGKTDLYWNYVRVRIWLIKEPSWIYGDINMDGVVDAKDLYILSRNYGKTFSLLSLSGIVAIGGIQTYKTRKKTKATEK